MCVNKHHSHNSVFVAFLASFFYPPLPLQLYSPLSKHLTLYTCPAATY